MSDCLSKWQKRRLALAELPTVQGRHVAMQHGDYDLHIDDRLFSRRDAGHATATTMVETRIVKAALKILVPF